MESADFGSVSMPQTGSFTPIFTATATLLTAASLMRLSESIRKFPAVTMRSPGSKPFVI
jgi:hypothetical protein